MKINYVELLSPFRGLKTNYRFELNNVVNDERIEPICFVGLNGSGKSNVLELIAECFFYLEAYISESDKKEEKKYQSSFGFEIEFELNPAWSQMDIPWDRLGSLNQNTISNIKIKYEKQPNSYPIMKVGDDEVIFHEKIDFILPNRIIGYSSGMNELISNPFTKVDCFYYDKYIKKENLLSYYDLNRMFFMDYESNKIITLCTQIFNVENNIQKLNEEIKLKDIYSFCIYIKLVGRNYKKIKISSAIELIIEKLGRCAIKEELDSVGLKGRKHKFYFKIDENSRKAFTENWNNGFDLFKDLYQLRLLNLHIVPDYLIKKAKSLDEGKNLNFWMPKTSPQNQLFYIDDITFINEQNEKIFYKHLSDGEHQLMHVLSGLMLLEFRNSIFILDEPDTHFNPEWRSKFVYLLNIVLKEKHKEQIIFLSTHSPFVVSDCKPENVYIFKKGIKPFNPTINTYGSSVNLITMNVFEKTDTIASSSSKDLEDIGEQVKGHTLNIEEAILKADRLGESIEKTLLLHSLLKTN